MFRSRATEQELSKYPSRNIGINNECWLIMLDRYVRLIKNGEVVAFPTETVYGLGADARNPSAIQKVFDVKGRPANNPLIVHVSTAQMVEEFADTISEDARTLMDYFWPGPLTLIFPKKEQVLDIITAGLDTVAVRWPRHPLSQELIALTGALVAPSANSSGRPSPTKPRHVKEDFGNDFPVIEAGETEIGLESTVLDLSSEPYQIYRPGAVSAEEIKEVITKEIHFAKDNHKSDTAAKSPGTKYTHYSPQASVRWLDKNDTLNQPHTLYLLHHSSEHTEGHQVIHYQRNYRRMAHELYDRFRQADHDGLKTIFIEPFSTDETDQQPLRQAIVNRISKAAEK